MKLFFAIRGRIPRLVIRYRSLSTGNRVMYKDFILPSRIKSILLTLRQLLLNEPNTKDELGIIKIHDKIYDKDDIILAVGLGSGISLVHNCNKPRIAKSFIGIEASTNNINHSIMNAQLNGIIDTQYKLINGFAGIPTNVINESSLRQVDYIDINKMSFDVLELDCEGSEIEILNTLTARPKHIIVEMHPMFREINITEFLNMMSLKGYDLSSLSTVYGQDISISEIDTFFYKSHILLMKKGKVDWGDGLLVLHFQLL